MRAALAAMVVATAPMAAPVAADGPALAHLTVGHVTLTLTAQGGATRDVPMIFAQRHLGFALPPVLEVALGTEDAETPAHLRLTGNGPHDLFLSAEWSRLVPGADEGVYVIEATGYPRGPNWPEHPHAVRIEIHLRSP